jgi:uncharacterized protein YukE
VIGLTAPVTEHGITAPGGDPAELRDVARFLRAVAEAYTQVAGNVRRAAATVGGAWSGPASFVFQKRVNRTTSAIDTAPVACAHAATALEHLADALERARQRALAAQATAGAALGTLEAVSQDRAVLAASLAADPFALRSLAEREAGAKSDLQYARRQAEDATADARTAASQAAAALIAAADSIGLPPQPAEAAEVPPFESTGHWAWRQFFDAVFDPLQFWQMPGIYKPGRSITDTLTAGGGALFGWAKEHRAALFKAEARITKPGLWLPVTSGEPGLTPHDLKLQRTWVQQPPITTTIVGTDVVTTAKVVKVAKVAGPVGTALSYGTAALDQWYEDRDRSDLSGAEKTGRVLRSSAIVGTTSLAGGIAGAKLGALAGAAIGSSIPVVGTLAGGAIGGAVGAIVGSGAGQVIGSKIKDWIFG